MLRFWRQTKKKSIFHKYKLKRKRNMLKCKRRGKKKRVKKTKRREDNRRLMRIKCLSFSINNIQTWHKFRGPCNAINKDISRAEQSLDKAQSIEAKLFLMKLKEYYSSKGNIEIGPFMMIRSTLKSYTKKMTRYIATSSTSSPAKEKQQVESTTSPVKLNIS